MFCGFPLFVQDDSSSPDEHAVRYMKLTKPFIRSWTCLVLSAFTNILAALHFGCTIVTLDRKTRLSYFNRTQFRVVICFLTRHNTLKRLLYLMRLINNPSCKRCGAEKGVSVNILCDSEILASLRHAYLGYFFLEPEDIKSLNLEAIWDFKKEQGSLDLVPDYGVQRPCFKA